MKKILASLAAIMIAGIALADTSVTVTNALGQIITITTPSAPVIPGMPAAVSRSLVGALGAQVLSKGSVAVPANVTPRDIGDVLIGLYNTGTNGVWISTGVTGSDWALVGTSVVP